jgi:hypothetical protein
MYKYFRYTYYILFIEIALLQQHAKKNTVYLQDQNILQNIIVLLSLLHTKLIHQK